MSDWVFQKKLTEQLKQVIQNRQIKQKEAGHRHRKQIYGYQRGR